jgi:hypothetical protein
MCDDDLGMDEIDEYISKATKNQSNNKNEKEKDKVVIKKGKQRLINFRNFKRPKKRRIRRRRR